jgi:2-polyprenyl-6-methoxyphenol hydroxylase-like FAD-dependent oxidoreductase
MIPQNILIIGGGIAGCCAAISLSQHGHHVQIIEKQDAWRFQSSGIFVYANGLVSLEKLGLLEAILEAGFAVPGGRNAYFDHAGHSIVDTVYPSANDGQIPAILGIKRAEMHRVMAARVAELGVSVRLGATAAKISETGNGVEVTFFDGTTGDFDLVIGADGLRSETRAMIGFEQQPRYTGLGVWRSVHKRPADLTDKIMMMGPAKRFGIMPISDDLLYTFGTVAEPKGRYYPRENWPDEMRAKFAEFAEPAAAFLGELGPSSGILFTAVEEVAMPLPWHRGRVLLIGDAAHASTPFMGQGGAMAMQDAVVLTDALSAHKTLEKVLTAFGAARIPVCEFVQNASRAVGKAGAAEQNADLSTRNADMRKTAQASVDSFYQKLSELIKESEKHLC